VYVLYRVVVLRSAIIYICIRRISSFETQFRIPLEQCTKTSGSKRSVNDARVIRVLLLHNIFRRTNTAAWACTTSRHVARLTPHLYSESPGLPHLLVAVQMGTPYRPQAVHAACVSLFRYSSRLRGPAGTSPRNRFTNCDRVTKQSWASDLGFVGRTSVAPAADIG
jgi:hypothetical protein